VHERERIVYKYKHTHEVYEQPKRHTMNKFYIIENRFNAECKREYYLEVIIKAETKRKAQSKAKKIFGISFSGQFGAMCLTEEEAKEFHNLKDAAGYLVFDK